jgi:hypothetical protein
MFGAKSFHFLTSSFTRRWVVATWLGLLVGCVFLPILLIPLSFLAPGLTMLGAIFMHVPAPDTPMGTLLHPPVLAAILIIIPTAGAAGVCIGLPVGLAQSQILASHLERSLAWTAATTIGLGIGLSLVVMLFVGMALAQLEMLDALGLSWTSINSTRSDAAITSLVVMSSCGAMGAITGGAMGMIQGFLQMWVLRDRVARSYTWIGINMASYMVGTSIIMVLGPLLMSFSLGLGLMILPVLLPLGFFAAGAPLAGIGMQRLLTRPPL